MTQTAQQRETWAIVPIKKFSAAKIRLSGALNSHERATLAKAMAADVLEQLARTEGIAGTLVVTADADAHALAADFGAIVANDSDDEMGINGALASGISAVRRFRRDPAIMIVPADVPFVTSLELATAAAALREAEVVLTAAIRDGGTNILGLSPSEIIAPAFGPQSFAAHVSRARSIGVEPLILELTGAAHDIDVPTDLLLKPSLRGGPRTLACLTSFRHFSPRRQLELVTE